MSTSLCMLVIDIECSEFPALLLNRNFVCASLIASHLSTYVSRPSLVCYSFVFREIISIWMSHALRPLVPGTQLSSASPVMTQLSIDSMFFSFMWVYESSEAIEKMPPRCLRRWMSARAHRSNSTGTLSYTLHREVKTGAVRNDKAQLCQYSQRLLLLE